MLAQLRDGVSEEGEVYVLERTREGCIALIELLLLLVLSECALLLMLRELLVLLGDDRQKKW